MLSIELVMDSKPPSGFDRVVPRGPADAKLSFGTHHELWLFLRLGIGACAELRPSVG